MKVLVGMSGGVDSSIAALLLVKQGHDVTGVTAKFRPDSDKKNRGCCSLEDIDDARRVAYKLCIDHIVMNFTKEFEDEVIKDFVENYKNGITPNPCIMCNQKLKFDSLLRRAISLGFEGIATGHYAVIEHSSEYDRWILKKSNSSKDQSYVLYGMRQEQLSRTLMPLSNMQKEEVRKIAAEYDLPVANKPDSQEICFVDGKYSDFIHDYSGDKPIPGYFVDDKGTTLGKHSGITKYTIGQRKGLGLSFKEPMFVTKIDARTNTITIGNNLKQYKKTLTARDLNFIPIENLKKPMNVLAKLRYQAKPCEALVTPIGKNRIRADFLEPQKAITPGQAVVFYQGDLVIGGGIIE
ncbi:MAG: tRNA 2-thiouridine(34) synthase MnmA [Oscillospiraceae bacterium]|jgi:tRNA-specific 2-thiouridylase|nr:tRNA 2-thiouridine(34) synthase MnmA [Oscillospiraceae bacterium]